MELTLKIDRTEDDWFACSVKQSHIQDYIDCLKLNILEAETFIANKAKRDGEGKFHLTVITPLELESLGYKPETNTQSFNVKIKGIGLLKDGNTETYFLVLESPEIMKFRNQQGLPDPFYPHITLGFSKQDIHGIAKDKVVWSLE